MKGQLGWMLIAMIAFFLPPAEAQNVCSYSIKDVNFPQTITENTMFQVDVTVDAYCPSPPPNYAGTFVSIRDLTTYDCTRFGSGTSGCSTQNSVDFRSGTRTFSGQIPWDHGFMAGSHTFEILVINDLSFSPDVEMARRSLIETINPVLATAATTILSLELNFDRDPTKSASAELREAAKENPVVGKLVNMAQCVIDVLPVVGKTFKLGKRTVRVLERVMVVESGTTLVFVVVKDIQTGEVIVRALRVVGDVLNFVIPGVDCIVLLEDLFFAPPPPSTIKPPITPVPVPTPTPPRG